MSIKQSTKELSHVTHAERDIETKEYRELWTQHKIVLIAYEAQFMYGRKPYEPCRVERKGKREVCSSDRLKYETGFVLADMVSTPNVEAKKYIQDRKDDFKNLARLLESSDEALQDLKQLLNVMLQIKNTGIVDEFAYMYDMFVEDLIGREYSFDEEYDRRQWQTAVLDKIMQLIQSPSSETRFPNFRKLQKEDSMSFKKLVVVEAYCFLAERFGFNINQYYCDAFQLLSGDSPSKIAKIDKSH